MSAPANDNRSDRDLKTALSGHSKCPICEAPTVTDYRPFCSRRCADLDLSRWLNGVYAVPARPDEDMDEADFDAMVEDVVFKLPRD